MCGAGISTSSGIPDFRSPKTGLYAQLEAYNLPYPEAIFDLEYFEENPQPFYLLMKELLPSGYNPSKTHHFLKLLQDKNLLVKLFTQNIDGLEYQAGINPKLLIEAHGHMRTSKCIQCNYKCETSEYVEQVRQMKIQCCPKCENYIKPDIVFFGEGLPPKFFVESHEVHMRCDLLIILGTSLSVAPFNNILLNIPDKTPILLINKEDSLEYFFGNHGMKNPGNKHYKYIGDCDEAIELLVKKLGWEDEFSKVNSEKKKNSLKKEGIEITIEEEVEKTKEETMLNPNQKDNKLEEVIKDVNGLNLN
ncbi:SIR2-domain-containing protein [Neoconidiobolus thromboides FSU 785]|nr:SIR2-domain-containing protein [Neoconidiobolus thromboides FSU 785]